MARHQLHHVSFANFAERSRNGRYGGTNAVLSETSFNSYLGYQTS